MHTFRMHTVIHFYTLQKTNVFKSTLCPFSILV